MKRSLFSDVKIYFYRRCYCIVLFIVALHHYINASTNLTIDKLEKLNNKNTQWSEYKGESIYTIENNIYKIQKTEIPIALIMGKSNVLAGNALEQGSKSDSTIIEYLKEYGIHTTNNKEIKILKSGHEKFIDLFKEINKAQHHIHLEYFNFRNDSIANALFELLAKKAEEGVEVRALFDSF